MTIASEITRLQWAKSSARTSIQNKGVTVPASAKLDTYHNYIDQINTGGSMLDSLTLKPYLVATADMTPLVDWFISWKSGSKYYTASIVYSEERNTSYERSLYCLVCATKEAGSDMKYYKAINRNFYSSTHSEPEWVVFYKSAIGPAIRCFFYETSSELSNKYFWFQCDWNYETNAVSVVNFDRTSTTTLPSSADTTGYYRTTQNDWVKSITWIEIEDDSYIYLTLK